MSTTQIGPYEPNVTFPAEADVVWAVMSLFVIGAAAAAVLVAAGGPIRLPAAVAAGVTPWLSHRILRLAQR